MREFYRIQILPSEGNPDSFELRFSANHVRNQLLVTFHYHASAGVAERLHIKQTGHIAVKITKLVSLDKHEDQYSFDCFSPFIGEHFIMSGGYSVAQKVGFLRVKTKN